MAVNGMKLSLGSRKLPLECLLALVSCCCVSLRPLDMRIRSSKHSFWSFAMVTCTEFIYLQRCSRRVPIGTIAFEMRPRMKGRYLQASSSSRLFGYNNWAQTLRWACHLNDGCVWDVETLLQCCRFNAADSTRSTMRIEQMVVNGATKAAAMLLPQVVHRGQRSGVAECL